MTQEQDHRIDILNGLLRTPHRDLASSQPFHTNLVSEDPLFYRQLGAWYNANGEIRDHKQLFVANMIADKDLRDVGLAILRDMPPFVLMRVVDYLKSGLKKNLPRSLHTEIERYLREREGDNNWFDSCALTARKQMKRMYALCHIAPSDRAQSILFDGEPPADSKLGQLKALRNASTPAEQAEAIIANKIPYRIASTVIEQMTPTIIYALIDVMSPQELINNVSSLKKRGAFDNPDLKNKIQEKLEKAKTAKGVAALKSMEARKVLGEESDITSVLADVADSQIKSKGLITADTALLIDKSYSMSSAIQLAKEVGSMISAAMEEGKKFYAWAFDNICYPINTEAKTLAGWEKAMFGIKANGGTHNGAAVLEMIKHNQRVDQIVMITDEGENGSPNFSRCLQRYVNELGVTPTIKILRVGSDRGFRHTLITNSLRNNGFDVQDYDIRSDYYSHPEILKFIQHASRYDLLMEIMEFTLPERKAN